MLVSLLHALTICLLAVGVLGSPMPTEINGDTNAARLARGLPLKKPARTFDPSRTVARRQEPSGATQTGVFVISDRTPTRKRGPDPTVYVGYSTSDETFVPTTDITNAQIFKIPGSGPFSAQNIQWYDPDHKVWQYLTVVSVYTGAVSGEDVVLLAPSQDGYSVDLKSSNHLSVNWPKKTGPGMFNAELYTGVLTGGSVPYIVGASSYGDVTDAMVDVKPVTLTFMRNVRRYRYILNLSAFFLQIFDPTSASN
ncbi:uncharacterized protein I303_104869 [Kwoniella dejecticola CBS 10117]|uniref:Peptidase A1 domain-containing protein n=1 Tax=Kwoniella dejecticola CBS 10117 TaxID=1296121 RepID=A0A1A6A444_9TREE|nr:uncharacterized protein I303_04147 [Kwoniella dejecticola CBS 10117]OBR84826.1 hypothetical protein I303_04147 [Kwoniella dejecticola CBS 10117]